MTVALTQDQQRSRRADVAALKRRGLSIGDIASRLDLTVGEVCGIIPRYRWSRPLPESIGEVRRLLGMTKTQLAGALGVSARTIARWEGGRGKPQYLHRREIARLVRRMWGKDA